MRKNGIFDKTYLKQNPLTDKNKDGSFFNTIIKFEHLRCVSLSAVDRKRPKTNRILHDFFVSQHKVGCFNAEG